MTGYSGEVLMDTHNEMREFETGAQRDGGKKPLMQLISPHLMQRLGEWLRVACQDREPPYPERNWEKGFPFSTVIGSLQRHVEDYKLGKTNEDHLAAIAFNTMALIHFEEEIKAGRLPAELDDMPKYAQRLAVSRMVAFVSKLIPTMVATTKEFVTDFVMSKPGPYATKVNLEDLEFDPAVNAIANRCAERLLTRGTAFDPPVDFRERPRDEDPSISFTIYLCGPITGRPVDHQWREEVRISLALCNVDVLDPLRDKEQALISNQGLDYNGERASIEMADRDKADLEQADLILAHFPYVPDRQSIGSWMEMGAAAIGLGKPVILVSRHSGINDHLFVRRFCERHLTFHTALHKIRTIAKEKTCKRQVTT